MSASPDETRRGLAAAARAIAAVALAAVDPERLTSEALRGEQRSWGGVLALGKAAAALARGVSEALAPDARRLLVRPHHAPALLDPRWEQLVGGHPLPNRGSLAAGERALVWLAALPAERPLLALVSGGSSACIEAMAGQLSLDDLVVAQRALLGSGLPISAFNAVRKHISRFKGGGALRACRTPVLALLLSDVPGDDPSTIGSGPFAADPTTYDIALHAVADLDVPTAFRAHLAAGARGEIPETLKPGDPQLARVETRLLGGNGTAVAAAFAEASRRGFSVEVGDLSGEAALAGQRLVTAGRALPGPRVALVLGGETTVTLGPSPGEGGRNQELALAAAQALAGSPGELVLSLATDGEDGPTRAAGAVVDGRTWQAIRDSGRDPAAALARHDAYAALARAPQSLLMTGPTGTNVADLALYLRAGEA